MNVGDDMLNAVFSPGRSGRLRLGVLCLIPAFGLGVARAQETAGQTADPTPGATSFNIFLRGVPVGVERVELVRLDDGWSVRSSGDLPSPIDRRHRAFEMEYDRAWSPRRLSIDGTRQGASFVLETEFAGGTATSRVEDENGEESVQQDMDPASVVLPDYIFSAYEAMAARLSSVVSGDRLPVYVPPRGQTEAVIGEIIPQQLETAQGRLQARIYRITFDSPQQRLDAEVWVADNHRLLRVFLPSVSLDIARQDISLVSTRLTGVTVPGDTSVRIASRGFSLASALTVPQHAPMPEDGWPAVVLVPGTESADRDEFLSGVPIHGHLATTLSAAGYVVVRYDRRGVGQSGGRAETATLDDYAADVRAAVDYLRDRDDIDRDRIGVIGHGEGGWIGLEAASRERRITALALVGTPSTDGVSWVLERQETELDRIGADDEARADRLDLQRRLNAAVLGNGPWDDIPSDLRQRADTRWFRSFLEFDPAEALRRARQPLLVMHGRLDRAVALSHAERLAAVGSERRRQESTVDLVSLPGVNHLLLDTTPGGDAASTAPASLSLSPLVTSSLVAWLDRVLARQP